MRQALKGLSCEENLKEHVIQFEEKKSGHEIRYVKRCHRENDQALRREIMNILERAYILFSYRFCTAPLMEVMGFPTLEVSNKNLNA